MTHTVNLSIALSLANKIMFAK